ncbi:Transient receptor potential cation channel subfamily V member [Trichinella spiralis]|uniref:Transient receptor potential cation channel subfamily V member n=1 Tax=Trichinella spiralis TaxID=6334 RepID=A0ABR3K8N4_TRISP
MITYQTSDDTILKGYCIVIAIHPTFYAVGDVFISGATLIMAFETLLLNKFPLIYYTTVSVVDVSLCWTDILTNNEPIPIACYYELVVSQTYFNIHLAYTGTVGFVGVLIFVAWLLYMQSAGLATTFKICQPPTGSSHNLSRQYSNTVCNLADATNWLSPDGHC